MAGREILHALVVRGRAALHLFTAADTTTTGVTDGTLHPWDDTTANITRLTIYSLRLDKWTEFGSLAPLVTTTVTGSLTLDDSDDVVLCDATSGAITVTLPAAASATGMEYHVKKIDSSANAVTVDGDGSETIDGATTQVITTQWDSANVVSDGSAWFII